MTISWSCAVRCSESLCIQPNSRECSPMLVMHGLFLNIWFVHRHQKYYRPCFISFSWHLQWKEKDFTKRTTVSKSKDTKGTNHTRTHPPYLAIISPAGWTNPTLLLLYLTAAALSSSSLSCSKDGTNCASTPSENRCYHLHRTRDGTSFSLWEDLRRMARHAFSFAQLWKQSAQLLRRLGRIVTLIWQNSSYMKCTNHRVGPGKRIYNPWKKI